MATKQNEVWKEVQINTRKQRTHYAISNLGHICSFKEKPGDGKSLNGTLVNGYPALKLKINHKDYQFYIHKLVAEYFVKGAKNGRSYVIHTDHNKLNNKSKNLQWASRKEVEEHQQKSPLVKAYRARTREKGHKLTAVKVKQIKQQIFSGNRRLTMRQIADKFNISEMQIYRIKNGENWGHVKV
jgi:hypothetical protein